MNDLIKEILETSGDEVSIFRMLDDEERRKVADCFELIKCPSGSIYLNEGDKVRNIGIIASGKMRFERNNHITGRPALLAVLEKGAHVGDFSMMSESPLTRLSQSGEVSFQMSRPCAFFSTS